MIKKVLGVTTFTILLFTISQNLTIITEYIGKVLSVIAPIIIGLILSFILNILLNVLENKVFKFMKNSKKEKVRKFVRPISLVTTIVVAISILALLLLIIIPEIYDTVLLCIEKIPIYYHNILNWTDDLILKYDLNLDTDMLHNFDIDINEIIETIKTNFTSEKISEMLSGTVSVTSSVFSGIANFGIGFIVAIYILAQKEKIGEFLCRIFKQIITEKNYNKTCEICSLTYNSFSNFISGQAVDAIILGSLCFVAMSLFRLPSASIISLLIAVTALLPIVGAFIGEGIGFIIIAMIDPWKALFFIMLMTILQIIDNNFIYPKVMGESVGLPRILVLIAVIIGGKIGGALGILLGVPVLSVIYILIKGWLNDKENVDTKCNVDKNITDNTDTDNKETSELIDTN